MIETHTEPCGCTFFTGWRKRWDPVMRTSTTRWTNREQVFWCDAHRLAYAGRLVEALKNAKGGGE